MKTHTIAIIFVALLLIAGFIFSKASSEKDEFQETTVVPRMMETSESMGIEGMGQKTATGTHVMPDGMPMDTMDGMHMMPDGTMMHN